MQFLEVEKWRAVQHISLMDGKWGALDSFSWLSLTADVLTSVFASCLYFHLD
jgi:hypothetical protein